MALVDTETGECGERRPAHREEAEQFLSGGEGTQFERAGGDGIERARALV